MNQNSYVLPLNRQVDINNMYYLITNMQNSSAQAYNDILALEQDIFEQKKHIKNLGKSDPLAQEWLKILEKQLKCQTAIFTHTKNMLELYREGLEAEFAYDIKLQSELSQKLNQKF